MLAVQVAAHISHLTGVPEESQGFGTTVGELIQELDAKYPGFARYVIQENGCLRQHVEVLIDDHPIADRSKLMDSLRSATRVHFREKLPVSSDRQ